MQLKSENLNKDHPDEKLKDVRRVPWFNTAVGFNQTRADVLNKESWSNHMTTPGFKSEKSYTLYYPDAEVLDSPEFQRYIHADLYKVESELNSCMTSDSRFYLIEGPTPLQIHPQKLIQFIAMTEYCPRMLAEQFDEQMKNNPNEQHPLPLLDIIENTTKNPVICVSTTILNKIIAEKHTGRMDRNLHVMRIDQPLTLILQLKDFKSPSADIIKRMRDKANKLKIEYVKFYMTIQVSWDPWFGIPPGQVKGK